MCGRCQEGFLEPKPLRDSSDFPQPAVFSCHLQHPPSTGIFSLGFPSNIRSSFHVTGHKNGDVREVWHSFMFLNTIPMNIPSCNSSYSGSHP
ncbi:uncharacterized protein LOC103170120 isoform X2 [Ornithorhynchus anatinus]|uniref:uncharacterized protein LOC103170120 isoform X2 n=1 Tax=Ornithorhynchus anatinus TaxID=9258 RepID=UPI0010A8F633|nr:uncharacterized protein LOC103170120 isoform X2 [Ornithorhynchus anatinus]